MVGLDVLSVDELKSLYQAMGGVIEEVNIFGFRLDAQPQIDQFNDVLGYFTEQEVHMYPGTTHPGITITQHPMDTHDQIQGAAHLVPGFFFGCWCVGIHQRNNPQVAHQALIQIGNVMTVWRDVNKDFVYEQGEPIQTGWFGIDMHRAGAINDPIYIQDWSGGCQVFASHLDFEQFMNAILSSQNYKQNGNKARFSYMLFEPENYDNSPI